MNSLSRRERQIMDIIYRAGQATAAEVQEAMTDPPSYSAVRALLTILVNKGLLRIGEDGPRYVYRPVRARQHAARSAIRHVLDTFFEGSVGNAVAALLEQADTRLTREEIARLQTLIDRAKKGDKE